MVDALRDRALHGVAEHALAQHPWVVAACRSVTPVRTGCVTQHPRTWLNSHSAPSQGQAAHTPSPSLIDRSRVQHSSCLPRCCSCRAWGLGRQLLQQRCYAVTAATLCCDVQGWAALTALHGHTSRCAPPVITQCPSECHAWCSGTQRSAPESASHTGEHKGRLVNGEWFGL